MSTEEQLNRLTGIVDALASTVVAHDNQIGALIELAEKHQKEMETLQREWRAYLRRLPPQ